VFTCGGEVAEGHGRRSQAAAAAGAVASASRRTGLGNKQQQDLLQCPGETPKRLDGRENLRAQELGVDNNHGAGGGALVVTRERGSCRFIGGRDAQRRWLGHQVVTRARHGVRHGPGVATCSGADAQWREAVRPSGG
jgi:hypothetical protein